MNKQNPKSLATSTRGWATIRLRNSFQVCASRKECEESTPPRVARKRRRGPTPCPSTRTWAYDRHWSRAVWCWCRLCGQRVARSLCATRYACPTPDRATPSNRWRLWPRWSFCAIHAHWPSSPTGRCDGSCGSPRPWTGKQPFCSREVVWTCRSVGNHRCEPLNWPATLDSKTWHSGRSCQRWPQWLVRSKGTQELPRERCPRIARPAARRTDVGNERLDQPKHRSNQFDCPSPWQQGVCDTEAIQREQKRSLVSSCAGLHPFPSICGAPDDREPIRRYHSAKENSPLEPSSTIEWIQNNVPNWHRSLTKDFVPLDLIMDTRRLCNTETLVFVCWLWVGWMRRNTSSCPIPSLPFNWNGHNCHHTSSKVYAPLQTNKYTQMHKEALKNVLKAVHKQLVGHRQGWPWWRSVYADSSVWMRWQLFDLSLFTLFFYICGKVVCEFWAKDW